MSLKRNCNYSILDHKTRDAIIMNLHNFRLPSALNTNNGGDFANSKRFREHEYDSGYGQSQNQNYGQSQSQSYGQSQSQSYSQSVGQCSGESAVQSQSSGDSMCLGAGDSTGIYKYSDKYQTSKYQMSKYQMSKYQMSKSNLYYGPPILNQWLQKTISCGIFQFIYDRSFMDKMEHLTRELRTLFPLTKESIKRVKLCVSESDESDKKRITEELIGKINQLIENNRICDVPPHDSQPIDSSQSQSTQNMAKNQKIQLKCRKNWVNTTFTNGSGVTMKSVTKKWRDTNTKRAERLVFILKKIIQLLQTNTFITKRELYYYNMELFCNKQCYVDNIVDDIAALLNVSRAHLHIVASSRGLVYGHLRYNDSNRTQVNCLSLSTGITVPNDSDQIYGMESDATFILVIEKHATFQYLIDLKIQEQYPLIMLTGRGYPDLNTRAFLNLLWINFRIPIFVFADADPYGIEILSVYRYGSLSLSYDAPHLVAPQIRWLGILTSDIQDFQLKKEALIPLGDGDRKKIRDLYERPYIQQNEQWKRQLQLMEKNQMKAEIQALAEHSPTYLIDIYIPAKIRYGLWI